LAALSIINSLPAQTGCAPVPAGLVGWWAGEGNASDSTGAHDGVIEGRVTFAPGEVGQAFVFNGTDADVHIPASATLNVGAGSGMSVEAWIKPAEVTAQHPLVEWNDGSFGAELWLGVIPPLGTGPGCLYGSFIDASRQPNAISSAGERVAPNVWQHVAMTYDKTTGIAVLYLNGAVVQQETLGVVTPLTTGYLWLGLRPYDAGAGLRYAGEMDEVSVYNRALSAAEIQAIYAAGSSGKCALPPVISTHTAYAFTNLAGLPGVSGSADGTGSAARFNWPDSVAVDGAGNVYVADENNSTVRKVTPGGMVTTLAGLAGGPGSADGTESAARFNRPLGVAVDSAGNVYVADCANDTIRKVTPAGGVTTLAGLAGAQGSADGTGSAARFYSPGGVAVDSTGNVYVADSYNHAIRKITPAGGVTTLAGLAGIAGFADGLGSAARFYVPASVAVDPAGNVYVADQFNQSIRKISPAGLVATLAGQVENAGSADGVGRAAQFYYPRGVAVDSAGNVYVGDEYNHTIRQITPTGLVTTLAGLAGNPGTADGLGSAARFNNPGGVAVDGAGYLYVADIWNHRITKGTPPACIPHAATATATVVNGFVVAATITDGGCGYTNPPAVSFPGGGGTGAEATAVVANGVVVDLFIKDAGVGYTSATEVEVAPPFTVSGQPGCAPVPAGLAGWWAGEGDAHDNTGANNGVLEGAVTFVPGEVGRAFSFDGATAAVDIPASASLNLGMGGGMTIELWIKPVDVLTNQPLVEWNNGSFGVLLDIAVPVSVGGAGPGSFCGYFKDLNFAGHAVNSPPGALKAGTFQHVAVTYDKASGEAAAYLNGVPVGFGFLGAFTPMTLGDLYLGFRPFDLGAGIRYAGLMDEVSLYDRALSAAEIQAIYAAGSSGKCEQPPVIVVAPQSQTVPVGATLTLSVVASGSPPLSYQWSFRGSNLVGATNAFLTLTDVGLGAAGVYSVTVSDAGGAVTTSDAVLTVSSLAAGCVLPPAGLVGWWRAEGNANDSAGTDEGIPEGGLAYAPGEVGEAFAFNGTNADVHIPASATLNVGAGSGMSVEAWIKPAEVTAQHPLVEWNGGSFGAELWVGVIPPLGTGAGCLYGALVEASRQPNAISSAGGLVVTNVWQHVALTYDKTTGIAVLYLNGAVVQKEILGVVTPLTTGDLWLGLRPYEPNDSAAGLRYAGLMDEVSVYNRALSAAEVEAIYAAGSWGKCALAPVIAVEPQSQNVSVGGTVTLSVVASGSPPLSYQWSFKGSNLVGATNASLTLADVGPGAAGVYSVTVSDAGGAVTSSNATLTVSGQTSCAPLPAGLVGWWAGEGNANDNTGAHNGVLEGGVTFVPGEVGQAFSLDGTTAAVEVPASPSLNVGVGSGMSVEAWIRPADVAQQHPLFEWNDGSFGTTIGFSVPVAGGGGVGPGGFTANFKDVNYQAHIINSPPGLITTNRFHHVAATYDRPSGIAALYVDGASVAQTYLGLFTPRTIGGLYFGLRPYDAGAGLRFAGQMDEISVYSRALSAAEVQAIYAAGSSGKCALAPVIAVEPRNQTVLAGANAMFSVSPAGLPPTSFQWTFDGTNIAGATSATLLLTNVQFEQGGTYSVAMSNSVGYGMSAPATLTVLSPPQILSQPASAVGYFGESIALQVQAEGTPPLTYQWFFDGLPIPWATNAFLSLSNLQFTDAGAYSVQITNLYGSVVSGSAALIINPAGVSPGLYAGLTISGPVGKTYDIQYATSLNATNTWTTITNLTLTQPVQLWVDTSINVSGGTSRFYRVVVVP